VDLWSYYQKRIFLERVQCIEGLSEEMYSFEQWANIILCQGLGKLATQMLWMLLTMKSIHCLSLRCFEWRHILNYSCVSFEGNLLSTHHLRLC
jgi:hypothetical protein